MWDLLGYFRLNEFSLLLKRNKSMKKFILSCLILATLILMIQGLTPGSIAMAQTYTPDLSGLEAGKDYVPDQIIVKLKDRTRRSRAISIRGINVLDITRKSVSISQDGQTQLWTLEQDELNSLLRAASPRAASLSFEEILTVERLGLILVLPKHGI